MARIFPDAKDYITVNDPISPEQLKAIEKHTGFPLLAGQRDKFQYFKMTDATGKTIGVIIAATQKGEFGAIEFVTGFDTTGVIKGIYVQRSRERDQQFKDRAFLDQFIGKPINDYKRIRSLSSDTTSVGKRAVIEGLIKEFVCYNELIKSDK